MDNKKKIIIAVVAAIIIITIAIIVSLLSKDTSTVYTISFNTDGGNEVVSQQVEEGEKVTKPADPLKEGYEFLGWYLNGKYFNFETEVEGNLTLDAKWKEIVVEDDKNDDKEDEDNKDEVTKYTVTFNSDGGSSVSKQTVEEGKKVAEPKAPTKKGYTFKGWYLGSTKYNFSNKVTKNITLKAKWEKLEEQKPEEEKPTVKEYTVKFDIDGKIVSTKTVKEGEKVAEPSKPTKSGYTFKYWSLNGSKYNFSNEVKCDITLKAEWEAIIVKKATYKEEEVKNSVVNQVIIYVMVDGKPVEGTIELTSISGKTRTVNVPATGYMTVKGTYSSISNPKAK